MICLLSEFNEKTVEKYFKYKETETEFTNVLTKRAYERSIARFTAFTEYHKVTRLNFQKSALDTLFDDFTYYMKNEAKKVYADSTINFDFKVILNYFSYLMLSGVIINFNTSKENRDSELNKVTEDKIISLEEFDKLVDYLNSKGDYLALFMFYIAFYCGIKNKYLRELKYTDFYSDIESCFYYINRIKKDSPPYYILLPKAVYQVFQKIQPAKKRAYIFINEDEGKLYSERQLTRLFERYCKKAKINHYTAKDFRHSAIFYYVKDSGFVPDDICLRFNWDRNNYPRMYQDLTGIKY